MSGGALVHKRRDFPAEAVFAGDLLKPFDNKYLESVTARLRWSDGFDRPPIRTRRVR
jgi:hypothetical protein